MGDCGANLLGLLMGVRRRRGGRQDRRGGVLRAAADPARGAVPRHHVRGAQAAQVPPADLPLRQRALPPPHGAHRLQQPAHDRLPVRLDADARGARAGAALRPLQRPPRPLPHRLDARDDRARARRRWPRASTSCTCSRSSSSGALDAIRLRRLRPEASPAEIELDVAKDLETGEFEAVTETRDGAGAGGGGRARPRRAEQRRRASEQVDEDRVGAEEQRGGAQAPIAADGR